MAIRLKDVPPSPAYLVFHDGFDNGAMEVWQFSSFEQAQTLASERNALLESRGEDEGGMYKAYAKLPRVRVWKYHSEQPR